MFRRQFLVTMGAAGTALAGYRAIAQTAAGGGTIAIDPLEPGEDLFGDIRREKGGLEPRPCCQGFGGAHDFEEGGPALGRGAADAARGRLRVRGAV